MKTLSEVRVSNCPFHFRHGKAISRVKFPGRGNIQTRDGCRIARLTRGGQRETCKMLGKKVRLRNCPTFREDYFLLHE